MEFGDRASKVVHSEDSDMVSDQREHMEGVSEKDTQNQESPVSIVAGFPVGWASTSGTDDVETIDMCRVCRSAGDSALYYPCLCTGSIKYVHQDCLLEWLKYSKKEVCELCSHKYSFQPIYRSDMPHSLPISEIVRGLLVNVGRLFRWWAIYTLVLIAWVGVLPITACRIYRIVFSASISNILSLPFQLFSLENLIYDCLKGCFIVTLFVCAFISLVWLREQIIHGGPQEWLNLDINANDELNANGENVNMQANLGDAFVQNDDDDQEEEVELLDGDMVQGQEAVGIQDQGENDNWRDWERIPDELTWQRLLGLDGSLLFIEHVFWVISLNTLFTILFAFSPYKLGYSVIKYAGFASKITYFPTLTCIILGYFVLSFVVRFLHVLAKVFRLAPLYRLLGLCFLILKVFLLVLVEIGFFPIIGGWWLDICSLPLFASTLSRRIASFASFPTSSLFLHWLVGMVYVFYSASFVLVLREVLRPGVLWFVRNLNDPEFDPIKEMIELPLMRHLRRLVASTFIYFSTVLLVVYIPLGIISRLMPSVLPFNLSLVAETPINELSLELLILQVVLPAVLEQTQARVILKSMICTWCRVIGRALDLEHYLLPVEENTNNEQRAQQQAAPALGQGLAAQHHALLLVREPQGFQSYQKPTHFPLRIIILLFALSVTVVISSVLLCVVPVTLGRFILHEILEQNNVHELYTVAAGLYSCWLLFKASSLVVEYAPKGARFLLSAFHSTAVTLIKVFAFGVPMLLIIPLLTGTAFHLAIIIPLRVASYQKPILFPWQHWAMGVLHWKIFCAAVMMGPNWWMKHIFEQLYADGIRGLRVGYFYRELVLPVLASLSIYLSAPRVVCSLLSLFAHVSSEEQIVFLLYSYPAALLCTFCVYFVYWQCIKVKALTEKIRNEKYLVGTRLVNYEGSNANMQ